MANDQRQFYIDGAWVDPVDPRPWDVENPATEETIATVSLGNAADVDRAVAAARAAFEGYSQTTREERLALLGKIIEVYQRRLPELAEMITREMGAPKWLSNAAQAPSGLAHLATAAEVLGRFEFDETRGTSRVVREPIGVCAFITPWNWPANQIMCKVAPALAVGCTMVLKPSEVTPLSGMLIAEILDEAGVPKGVFNLVNGDGPGVGAALAAHPGVDMVSFTGSTRAGIAVAKAAADGVKRVTQELGGKSPNVILPSADLRTAITQGVQKCFTNSGQSCNAPTRMFVPRAKRDEAVAIAKEVASAVAVGDPSGDAQVMGPLSSKVQFDKVQGLIRQGIDEGATLVAGGVGKPDGISKGHFVKPTIFADVTNDMTIAREEIFGPVLSILSYDTEDEAVALANDTEYGLSAYVSAGSREEALALARRIRAGNVHLNGAGVEFSSPFGGYKKSGNGREWGVEGLEEFLETKAMFGAAE